MDGPSDEFRIIQTDGHIIKIISCSSLLSHAYTVISIVRLYDGPKNLLGRYIYGYYNGIRITADFEMPTQLNYVLVHIDYLYSLLSLLGFKFQFIKIQSNKLRMNEQ